MSLKDLDLKIGYRSDNKDELIRNFYIPVLSNAVIYKRAVGYFSSAVLLQLSKGISKLIDNNGKIQIVASPELNQDDIEAIQTGYELRDEVMKRALFRNFREPKNDIEKERYNYLAHLISNNQLDIKIALIDEGKTRGIYHEKIGIVEDELGNKVAFTGSLNETENAIQSNFESIDVYCSWNGGTDLERVRNKSRDFDQLWKNETNRLAIYDFPDAVRDEILNYKKGYVKKEERILNLNNKVSESKATYSYKTNYPKLPDWLDIRGYQQKAIDSWIANDYVGLLNMATGTGKTITALSGITKLWNDLDDKLVVIIVCPYTHLVEQWREDIVEFNMDPIIAYSSSDQKNWRKILDKKIHRYNLDIINHISIVTTNGTYKTDKFQQLIDNINENVVFVVDEVHNAGATGFLEVLNNNFEYRLALSATPKRHFDQEGTKAIFDYFDKQVYHFGLKRAIADGFLTQYYYYPQIVYLTNEEYDEYLKISKKAYKSLAHTDEGTELTEVAKRLLIKRARLVAGATNKLDELRELMKERTESNYNLVYCGSTYVEDEFSNREMRQIEAVTRILGNELNMRVAKFTAEESMEERKKIIKNFSDGETLQSIVAIKCLDEGVDIPAIENAYILASSTNPREFIQRRGRVLRQFKGKDFAYIYDFITLPRPIEEVPLIDQQLLKYDLSLVEKEVKRAKEFASLAENHRKALKPLEEIEEVYNKYSEEED
ncbi:DNA phosphorothioation system restriction enzyme [Halobacteroides halobius DSM 5150]|uniref:DNA phosphorothioation system restriction enzyme n=1 Tax=Halobacteroides halobius (strain ATCC 35273 / DSM 5150 / MD-1) TaxID=748449 RepID=L0KCE0_HALHC|nr:DEAD/DEAH box helicase family protein [Halobacteroides halobius]AGB42044.1 DNA phosphorothioation system restriction enzyme [Halobacteroides halobius DSM 5150]